MFPASAPTANSIQIVAVVQIHRPSQKRVVRTRRREVLLKFPQVVQLEIPDRRFDAHAFAQLDESWLACQARRGRIRCIGFQSRAPTARVSSDINKAPVDLAEQREIQPRIAFNSNTGLMALPPTMVWLIPNSDFPGSVVSLPRPKKFTWFSEIDCA